MMIRTKKDARALINQLDLFALVQGVIRTRTSFGSVDISRYNDDMWIGHFNENVMKLCPRYEDIVNFAYKHRREINKDIKDCHWENQELANADWDEIGELLRGSSNDKDNFD
ncbi:hypothetical protein [Anaerospora sp.]|uniref:hypothetical protein n=1 Tax=Anaerospora sp. TaxID=1960278 RepID=UPI0028A1182B|nr:hypothetical protein [Anaerospora sp.]